MRGNYQITRRQATGTPCAHIDNEDVWELVEYLAAQRTAVSYSHGDNHFVVHFLHVGADAAQALLDEWVNAQESECTSSASPLLQRA